MNEHKNTVVKPENPNINDQTENQGREPVFDICIFITHYCPLSSVFAPFSTIVNNKANILNLKLSAPKKPSPFLHSVCYSFEVGNDMKS